ncbi:MAG: hypothetical protein ACQES2_03645 [Pseudomonadota bacterium]
MSLYTRAIIAVLAAFSLSACAMLQGGGDGGEASEATASVMGSIVQQRVQAKGPDMFCSQPTYQQCIGLEQQACVSEMQSFADRCFNVAQQQTGGAGVSSASFATSYASCMTLNHALMHPERSEAIKTCVADADFDYAAMLRSILY